MDHLIFEREPDGDLPARVVSVDPCGPFATVETGMNQPDAGEGNDVDSIIETQVVLSNSRKGDLEEISRRGDLHQRTERKIPFNVVVDMKSKVEDCAVDRTGSEAQIRSEASVVLFRLS